MSADIKKQPQPIEAGRFETLTIVGGPSCGAIRSVSRSAKVVSEDHGRRRHWYKRTTQQGRTILLHDGVELIDELELR